MVSTILCAIWGAAAAFMGLPVIDFDPKFKIKLRNLLILVAGCLFITFFCRMTGIDKYETKAQPQQSAQVADDDGLIRR